MEAMALFGSQVSGGADEKSDKDLIIVCLPDEKKQYIKEYASYGYSISVYSPEQLKYMKEKGSLFIQHLKLESKIIFDKNNQFFKFLQTCPFIPPSDVELKRSIASLNTANIVPKSSNLFGWLADHMFVLSRDYLVKYFAQKNKLIFNINHLVQCIEDEFQLSKAESNLLLKLREAKYEYRNGSKKLKLQCNSVNKWIKVLQKIGVLEPHKKNCIHTNSTYLNMHKSYNFNSQYELLRYIESLRLLFPNVKCSNNKEALIYKLITRPNEYSSTSRTSKYFLNNYLIEFRNKANKSHQRGQFTACFFCATKNLAQKNTQ